MCEEFVSIGVRTPKVCEGEGQNPFRGGWLELSSPSCVDV